MTTEQVPSNQGSPMQELREIVENQTDGRQFLPVEMALLRRVVATHEPAPVRGDITLTSKGVCSVCECPDQDHYDWCTPPARELPPSKDVRRPAIRQLPAAEPRVETGPVVFGDDWPGTFIRGDNAFAYAMSLQVLIAAVGASPDVTLAKLVFSLSHIKGLLDDLSSSNLVKP